MTDSITDIEAEPHREKVNAPTSAASADESRDTVVPTMPGHESDEAPLPATNGRASEPTPDVAPPAGGGHGGDHAREQGSEEPHLVTADSRPATEPVAGPPAGASASEPTDRPTPVDCLVEAAREHARGLAALRDQVQAFHERAKSQENLIDRMQTRLEELQADQVRALLAPVANELAALHGDLSDVASRDLEAMSPERLVKELGILVLAVESSLELLGMETVSAAPGVAFDRRKHAATRRIPTPDPARDQTVAGVVRQGFAVEGADRATVPARVTVYEYDPAMPSQSATPPEASAVASQSLQSPTGRVAVSPPSPQTPPTQSQSPVPPGQQEG